MIDKLRASVAPALFGLALLVVGGCEEPAAEAHVEGDVAEQAGHGAIDAVTRGQYLVRVSGCNDCHTAGYMASSGAVPVGRWLMGDSVGFRGPWGTTYPTNLRLAVAEWSEDEWIERVRTTEFLPPMPWFNLRAMTNADLSAIYRFIVHLGPVGEPAPSALAPAVEPDTPYIVFEPVTPPPVS